MAQAKITLLGMYGYFDSLGDDLFELLVLPEGMSKETFTDTLFLDYGERAVLYSNPDLFKRMIGAWSSKWSIELSRIAKTLKDDYEPLWNIDRYEQVADKIEDEASERNSATLSETTQNTATLAANNGNTSNMTTENTTSAYNSSQYEPDNKTVQNGSGTETIQQTSGNNGTVSQMSGNNKSNDYSRDFAHTGHYYGNGGVTMSQQLAESEVKLREKYNLYHEACKLFSEDLLLYIY